MSCVPGLPDICPEDGNRESLSTLKVGGNRDALQPNELCSVSEALWRWQRAFQS
jgi:hypothetical protein